MKQGQVVVCIDDTFYHGIEAHYVALPKKGKTYIIRDVKLGISPTGEEGMVAVTLVNLHNPKSSAAPFEERAFNSERFRPLQGLPANSVTEKQLQPV